MNKLFGNTKRKRIISMMLLIAFVSEIITPTASFALTGGPSQPEVTAFTPVNTSEMVDLTSGDFKYNIPLMDVGGYPLNIAYDSGIGMDQEASWVGLGWNLNVGAINRNMRGLPDDFNGEQITKEYSMKDNNTYGVNVGVGIELFGYKKAQKKNPSLNSGVKLNLGIGLTYNNYNGIGVVQSANIALSSGDASKSGLNGSLGIKSSSSEGITISPNVSYSYKKEVIDGNDTKTTSASIGIGVGMNSRAGLKDLSFNSSYSQTNSKKTVTEKTIDGAESGYTKGSGLGLSTGSSINFGASTFIPQAQNDMNNNSVSLSYKFGTTIFGYDGDITLGGFFSNQSLVGSSSNHPAFGYMYSHEGQKSDNVLMDFNREKDQGFSRYTKNLPITNQTYDIFSVSGQGIGGSFRPFRSDIGYVFDNKTRTESDSYSLGAEFAATNIAHLGIDVSVVDVATNTGKWDGSSNDAIEKFTAKSTSTSNADYEPCYFKEMGEKSVNEAASLFDSYGGENPQRIKITGLINHQAKASLEGDETSSFGLPSSNQIQTRQKRNQVFSSLNYEEASSYGLNKSYYSSTSTTVDPTIAKKSHLAELTVLRNDGSRYVYGLPAYNTKQIEITFNASATQNASPGGTTSQNYKYDPTTGYVGYNSSDRKTSNKNGIDHYFNSIKLPPYAHSYLLTAIISPDYVDLTGDGPSDDDFGNYTKFEYTKVSGYNWRTPFTKDKANFNEAAKSLENDDQGNFIAGTKDLWFTTKIETKNYIALFELGDRKDAVGVSDEDGSPNNDNTTAKTKYIKSISLYSKPEYKASLVAGGPIAVPIKVVHFVYDYSLCPKIPNNTGIAEIVNGININSAKGKLTLKSIYFTYGTSSKASFSKYNFEYNQAHRTNPSLEKNFPYHPKAYDRWGNYKPLSSANVDYLYNSPLNNSEFPYVNQLNKDDADFYASAWNLSKITLPSGGEITVNYETDDYAFVQNKPAMQMMKVLDVTSSPSYSYSPTASNIKDLYNISSSENDLFIHFELNGPLTGTGSDGDRIRNQYIKEINSNGKYLYFRFLVNMTSGSAFTPNAGNHYEYVSGYAEIAKSYTNCGISGSTGSNPVAYIKLEKVKLNDKRVSEGWVNPIAKAAMNFGRTRFNNLIWDASFSPPADIAEAVKQLGNGFKDNLIKQLLNFSTGANKKLYEKQYCNEFVAGKSWIRLYNPNGRKFGGGSRVKELKITDNWNPETGGQDNSEYGQTYTYETELDGKTISSGVAGYEPMMGGDENPFRQPVFMGPNKWTILTADERFFMEEPFGETFFPSASIVYSKVKVKNRIPSEAITNLKTHGTGYVLHEFYTAKDYPTITSHTSIAPKQYKPALGSLLKVLARDYIAASQGYVIKLNDMHGKQKAQTVYPEGSEVPISKVEYFYKTKGGGYKNYGLIDVNSDAKCTPNELDNLCTIINSDGTIAKKTIGLDFDAVADFRQSETKTIMGGVQVNLANFLVGAFPGIVPTIWPDFSYEKTRFRSAVFTKVISNYGILETTTAQDLGSKVTTSNLAYDAQTGDVLITKTKNDFEDNVYSLKYPSFWGYDLMGPAYKNIGFTDKLTFTGSSSSVSTTHSYFYNVGDEIGFNGSIGWVCNVGSTYISVIDKNGNPFTITGNYDSKILRSGKRNLLSSQMASLTSLLNPIDLNNDGILDASINIGTNHKVINASAIEYSDQWQTFKGYDNLGSNSCTCSITTNGLNVYNYLSNLMVTHTLPASLNANSTSTQIFSYLPPSSNSCDFTATLPSSLHWNNIVISTINSPNYSISTYSSGCTGQIVISAIAEICAPTCTLIPFSFTLDPIGTKYEPFVTCVNTSVSNTKCGVDVGDKVNPFVYGIKGNWRPKTTWSYLNARNQTVALPSNNLNIRDDGYIVSYTPFYNLPSGGGVWTKNTTNWTFTSEISKMTPNGVEVENKDALNRYSSALYGYNESLPIAVSSNAQLQEIAFDGFEDYDYYPAGVCNSFSKEHHFDFYAYRTNLVSNLSHTGKYSIKVNPNSSLSISKKLVSANCTTAFSPTCNYLLTCNDFIQPFSPITAGTTPKKYILSYWVKEKITGNETTSALDYTNSSVNLSVSGGSGSVIPGSLKKSEIIDGWQRFEYSFSISAGSTGKINIALTNLNITGNVTSYFDDIRIHPFNSNIKTFVYNPVTLKYVAELDANNFATFYEYDDEGSLVRVKKETEKGIMTIQETKNHSKK